MSSWMTVAVLLSVRYGPGPEDRARYDPAGDQPWRCLWRGFSQMTMTAAVATDDLALVADPLDAGVDLHGVPFVRCLRTCQGSPLRGRYFQQSLLVAVDDPAAGQIVGAQLHDHAVLGEDADVVLTHLAGDVARTLCPFVSSTRNIALGNASTTVPSISMTPSFLAIASLYVMSRSLTPTARGHDDGRNERGWFQLPNAGVGTHRETTSNLWYWLRRRKGNQDGQPRANLPVIRRGAPEPRRRGQAGRAAVGRGQHPDPAAVHARPSAPSARHGAVLGDDRPVVRPARTSPATPRTSIGSIATHSPGLTLGPRCSTR